MGAIDPTLWARFQRWRMKLAAKVVETNAGRQFDAVLLPEPVPSAMAFYELSYTFFRIYLSLPEELRKEFDQLAKELAEIVKSS